MESLPKFHDANIEAIGFSAGPRKLTIGLVQSDGVRIQLECESVVGFELSPFCEQNVLFEANLYPIEEVPQHLRSAVAGVASQGLQQGLWVLELDASVGLGGLVVAGSFRTSGTLSQELCSAGTLQRSVGAWVLG